jgi:cysteine synthase A
MQGSVEKAEELNKTVENSVILGQFTNKANAAAHYKTTGPEIWRDTDGEVDIFVAGIGTGGTITGTGRYLKEKKDSVKIVGVEPADSPLITKGVSGPHKLQGIGANFIPDVLEQDVLDGVTTITTEGAYDMARKFVNEMGMLIGISAGAAIKAAVEEANKPENKGKTIVVLLPDSGERYLSTDLFDQE